MGKVLYTEKYKVDYKLRTFDVLQIITKGKWLYAKCRENGRYAYIYPDRMELTWEDEMREGRYLVRYKTNNVIKIYKVNKPWEIPALPLRYTPYVGIG